MKKTKTPSKFAAIIRTTYGKGKKAKSIDNEITVDFANDYIYDDIADHAVQKFVQSEFDDKCVNPKELRAAYKKWLAENP